MNAWSTFYVKSRVGPLKFDQMALRLVDGQVLAEGDLLEVLHIAAGTGAVYYFHDLDLYGCELFSVAADGQATKAWLMFDSFGPTPICRFMSMKRLRGHEAVYMSIADFVETLMNSYITNLWEEHGSLEPEEVLALLSQYLHDGAWCESILSTVDLFEDDEDTKLPVLVGKEVVFRDASTLVLRPNGIVRGNVRYVVPTCQAGGQITVRTLQVDQTMAGTA